MVVEPVIPNTVHMSIISAYHLGVYLGGMGLGARNLSRNVFVDCFVVVVLSLCLMLLFIHRRKIVRLR